MWEEESDTEIGTPEEIKRKQYWKELKKDMNQQKILCCCKPNMIHDESLKYQLLYTEENYVDNENLMIKNKITKEQKQEL